MKTRILLADDHRVFREGLRSLLEKEHGMEVVGEAENGREAVRLAGQLQPDVVIMDVGMHDMNGMEATRQVLATNSDVAVLALSMHSDKRFVAGMLMAGASGYLLKEHAFEEVLEAIKQVRLGKIYICPGVSEFVLEDYVRAVRGESVSPGSALSPREREIVQLLAEGKSTKEIARHLHLSVKTVGSHRLHIAEKLGMRNLAELTKFAIREGLTSLDQ